MGNTGGSECQRLRKQSLEGFECYGLIASVDVNFRFARDPSATSTKALNIGDVFSLSRIAPRYLGH
jgi:hypothetical protein